MALSSQLVLSQKTEEKTEKKTQKTSQKNKKFTRTDTYKKKGGVYLFIHLKALLLIEIFH